MGGRLATPMVTMFSSRVSASRGRLACSVPIEPSWPVFMACSRSIASGPRTSPRMMRSGRMRSAFFTRSRMLTSPLPSRLAGRVSRRTTCGCCMRSSAASSMVTTRSPLSIMPDRAFSMRRLARAGAARHDQVQPAARGDAQHRRHGRRDVALLGHLVEADLALAELADRHRGAVDGQRRDDDVDAAAVEQAGVADRARFVDAPADAADDAVADVEQMGVVLERDRGQVELAAGARCRSAWGR